MRQRGRFAQSVIASCLGYTNYCVYAQQLAMLTYRDLRQIQEGHRRNSDVMILLREVKRLRELAAQTYGALGYFSLPGASSEQHDLINALLENLIEEPAVIEYQTRRQNEEKLAFRRAQRHTQTPEI